MKLIRHFVIASAVGLALSAGSAQAGGNPPTEGYPVGPVAPANYGPPGGGYNPPATLAQAMAQKHHAHSGGQPGQAGPRFPQLRTRLQNAHLIQKPNLPVFQAAPWYQYWPYDGHFQTPAPISGPFYGPPLTGNFPVNPYFPGPAMPVGGPAGGAPGGR